MEISFPNYLLSDLGMKHQFHSQVSFSLQAKILFCELVSVLPNFTIRNIDQIVLDNITDIKRSNCTWQIALIFFETTIKEKGSKFQKQSQYATFATTYNNITIL